ncbi:MAG: TolC family protein [Pseudomonadota bacterium]
MRITSPKTADARRWRTTVAALAVAGVCAGAGVEVVRASEGLFGLRGSGSDVVDTQTTSSIRPAIAYDPQAPYTEISHRAELPRRSLVGTLAHDTFGLVTGSIAHAPRALLLGSSLRTQSDRFAPVAMPDRPLLRHSMVHAANVFDGLRGSEADVGASVALALRGSHTLRGRIARAQADHKRRHGALAAFFPKVEATFDTNRSPLPEDGGLLSQNLTQDVSEVSVQASLPVFTSGVNLNTYRQAVANARASDHAVLAEEHKVALEAVRAHIAVRLARRVEQTLGDNVAALNRIAGIARRLFEAGDASRTDIAIARANVESARAEQDLARKTREEMEVDYESLTGIRVADRLARPQVDHLVPETLDSAVALARQNNPTIAAAWLQADAGVYAAKATRGRYGPQASLYGGWTRELDHSARDPNDNEWTIGAKVRVPLVDFGAVPAIDAARLDALEAGYRAQDRDRLVVSQLQRQWTALQSARRRVIIIERQVSAIATSAKGTQREYEAGFRSITDVLADKVKLAGARITLEQARHEAWEAAYVVAFTTATPKLEGLAIASGQTGTPRP